MPTRINIIFGKGQIVAQPAQADITRGESFEVNPINLDQTEISPEVTITSEGLSSHWLHGHGNTLFTILVPSDAGDIEDVFKYKILTPVGYLDPEVIIRR